MERNVERHAPLPQREWMPLVVGVVLVLMLPAGAFGLLVLFSMGMSGFDDCGTIHAKADPEVTFPNAVLPNASELDRLPRSGDIAVVVDRIGEQVPEEPPPPNQPPPHSSTMLFPLSAGVLGAPVPFVDIRVTAISPTSRYVVVKAATTDIVRLGDRHVVARIHNEHGVIFTGDDEATVFGATPDCGPGEAHRISLMGGTSEIVPSDFEHSVEPLYMFDGDAVLCLQVSTDGSGANCQKTVRWNPHTGEQRDGGAPPNALTGAPAHWVPGGVPASALLPDGTVAYWTNGKASTTGLGGIAPLRLGAPSGPTGTDTVGSTPLDTPMMIVPIEDGHSVLTAKAGGTGTWHRCAIPELTCTEVVHDDPNRRYVLIGVVPASAFSMP